MNLLSSFTFQSEKPEVKSIWKIHGVEVKILGLGKNVELPRHHTPVPAFLFVLRGRIEFHIQNEVKVLGPFESLEIPVGIEHSVLGLEAENAFTLTRKLSNE